MNPEASCKWQNFLRDATGSVRSGCTLEVRGTLTRLTGLVLEDAGRLPMPGVDEVAACGVGGGCRVFE